MPPPLARRPSPPEPPSADPSEPRLTYRQRLRRHRTLERELERRLAELIRRLNLPEGSGLATTPAAWPEAFAFMAEMMKSHPGKPRPGASDRPTSLSLAHELCGDRLGSGPADLERNAPAFHQSDDQQDDHRDAGQ